jgi:transcriptional regulator with XRE-family HTH domain
VARRSTVRRFGEKLRTLRTRHGLSMQALAEKLNSDSGYISQVENDKRQPGIDFAMQVALFFEVSTDVLLNDALEVE